MDGTQVIVELDESYGPLPSVYLALLFIWLLSAFSWTFNTYKNRHFQVHYFSFYFSFILIQCLFFAFIILCFYWLYSCPLLDNNARTDKESAVDAGFCAVDQSFVSHAFIPLLVCFFFPCSYATEINNLILKIEIYYWRLIKVDLFMCTIIAGIHVFIMKYAHYGCHLGCI